MRALITGGTGHIGKAAVERLLQHSWDVRVVDIGPGVQFDGAEYVECNILNYDDLLRQMRGCDAVIHLAALRGPSLGTGHDVFQINVVGTFNVFEAAAAVGIRRVAQASSINALGCTYSTGDMKLDYFPIDEAHPTFTTDPYSFSKQTVEAIGAYYWRREGISSIAYRYPGVHRHGYTSSEDFQKRRAAGLQVLDELMSLSDSERQARLADARQRALDFRSTRPLEYRPDSLLQLHFADDPLFYTYALDRFNLWVNLDERDAAQSLEKGLTAAFEGDHALFVNDHSNWLGYDSRTLISLFFPDVAEIRPEFSGADALVSIEKARRLIGFEPEYSVQTTQT